jgi:aminoglycoside phosphotransferase (APT) family kinase protein
VAVYAYPNDRELALLPEIAGAETRTHRLSRLVPDRPGLWQAKPQRLSYKPERRYVARLVTDNGADAVLRVYNGSDYHHASSAVHAFTSREHVRVARCVARSDRGHALVLDWLSGQPLDQACLSLSFDVRCVQNVAAALAELHAQDGNSLTAVTPDAQTRTLVAAADAIASVCPQLARRAHRLAGKLESRLSEPSPPPRPIHGDFSADQVLLQDDGVGIIDFDAAIRGDPAADLGSFAAHVQREVVRDKLPAERAEAMIAELLEGYRIASRHDPTDRFRLHFAAALLHLAYSPFRYREPDWAQKAQSLLERAEEIAVNA